MIDALSKPSRTCRSYSLVFSLRMVCKFSVSCFRLILWSSLITCKYSKTVPRSTVCDKRRRLCFSLISAIGFEFCSDLPTKTPNASLFFVKVNRTYHFGCQTVKSLFVSSFFLSFYYLSVNCSNLSRIVRKPDFCLCENKRRRSASHCEADQRLCFRHSDSTISLLPKSEISSF